MAFTLIILFVEMLKNFKYFFQKKKIMKEK
jgi:hypothetical protein